MSRCAKIFSIVLLISVAASFILRLCFHFWAVFVNSTPNAVDPWLEKNQLSEYKEVFKNKGEEMCTKSRIVNNEAFFFCFCLNEFCVFVKLRNDSYLTNLYNNRAITLSGHVIVCFC